MDDDETGLHVRPHGLPIDPDTAGDQVEEGRHRWLAFARTHADVLAVISAGGALGSLGRWGLEQLLPWSGTSFPWATFAVNVTGALALGVLMVLVVDVWPPRRYVRPFVGVGLLGGWTTFSTYVLEARDLLAVGRPGTALAYVGGSLVAGLVAVWVGIALTRLVAVTR
ncbi:fluoride efflux transporter FluC [Nocardioides flavus (ex Wang et al. 2016)]|nr:CrcB family protein [Nocardioides flavus (ex Wang et al. 2016)]